MPTYDYSCQTCDAHFELFQSFSEDALKKCPSKRSGLGPAACTAPGRGKVIKVFSAPGIAFKGSGFYKNDSRSSVSASSKSSSSESASSNGSGSESSSSADTKKSSDTKSSTDSKAKSTSSSDK